MRIEATRITAAATRAISNHSCALEPVLAGACRKTFPGGWIELRSIEGAGFTSCVRISCMLGLTGGLELSFGWVGLSDCALTSGRVGRDFTEVMGAPALGTSTVLACPPAS